MPAHQTGHSGRYDTNLTVIFNNSEMSELDTTTEHGISVDMIPAVQANFVGITRSQNSASSSILDLGELYPGLQQRFGLQLRSNTEVDLELFSQNSGELRRKSDTESKINYNLVIAGKTLNMNQPGQVLLPADLSTNGTTSPLSIKIDDFDKAPAGDYSDTITFRISAR